MDGRRFDEIARLLASQTSRRAAIRTIGVGIAGGVLGAYRRFGGRAAGALLLGEACSTSRDCSGLEGVVCCGANAAKKGTCVNIDVDTENCGTCGVKCPAGKFCNKGRCCSAEGGTCNSLYDCCRLDVSLCCEGVCVFGEDASANCGSCGHACKKGEACCSFTCVNLAKDPQHCGTCKLSCDPKTEACCSGRCLNIESNRKNCGQCGNQCRDYPYEICEDGKCVRPKQTSAPGKTIPNLAYAALQAADLGGGYEMERGQMVYAPAALGAAGLTDELIDALAPGFTAAFVMAYQRADDSGAVESSVSVMRALYDSDAAALAAVETMFFSHTSYQADLTANYPMGDKGYTLLFDGPLPGDPERTVPVLETGMYVGAMLTVIATAGASSNTNAHSEIAGHEEAFARLVASGQAPEDDDLDESGLAPLALILDGVALSNLFPARIGGKDVPSVGQSAEARRNVKVAHGDATEVWLNNFTLPDSPYRIFNRIWAFASVEAAAAFGEEMPAPLQPTYDSVGIELLEGTGSQLASNQVAYDFTWPQADGAWFGYQVLFPLDRFYVSVSVADVAATSDLPLLLRTNLAMLSLEEIVRQYLEQLAEAIGKSLPFTLLPQIKPNAQIQGKQPEAGEGRPADASSSWSFERGTEVDAQLLIYGKTIDRGDRPEVMPCDKAFVIRSFWEDKTVRSCDGCGGAKDGENDVCKTALKNASTMAATIPCPKEDCTLREETEIWRGWRCFEDEPEKGDHSATCAVELKIVCNRDVRL